MPFTQRIFHLQMNAKTDCIFYNKTNEMNFLEFYSLNILYMFRIGKLFIFRRQFSCTCSVWYVSCIHVDRLLPRSRWSENWPITFCRRNPRPEPISRTANVPYRFSYSKAAFCPHLAHLTIPYVASVFSSEECQVWSLYLWNSFQPSAVSCV